MMQIAVTWGFEWSQDKNYLWIYMLIDGEKVSTGELKWPNHRPCKIRELRMEMAKKYEEDHAVNIIRDF